MNVFKEQSGVAVLTGLILLLGLSVIGGVGYVVYRAKHQPTQKSQNQVPQTEQNTTPPTTNEQTPPMGIDYPVPQGIQGQVFCTDKIDPVPCSTTIEIETEPSNPTMGSYGPIRTIETDTRGHFSIDLTPGSYTITPATKSDYPMFVPPLTNPVVVKDRQVTKITIHYHSGTR